MDLKQVAAELGLPVKVVRAAVKDIYRTSRKRDEFTTRHVRFIRWALVMAGKLAE